MFKTGVTQKIIVNSRTIQQLITNRKLIRKYYDDYLEYQIGSKRILPAYEKNNLLLLLDNNFRKLFNV